MSLPSASRTPFGGGIAGQRWLAANLLSSDPRRRSPMKTRTTVVILAGVALTTAFVFPLPADEPAKDKPGAEAGPTAEEALKRLKEGNVRFVADMPKEAEIGSKQRIELLQGQRPIPVVLP